MLPRTFDICESFPNVDEAQWRALVEQDLNGAPFERKLVTHTYEGLYVQPLYTARDWRRAGDPSGFSGLSPFTRGSLPLDHQLSGWDIRQQHDAPSPRDLNTAIHEDLAGGVTSILIRYDAAGRAGLDPDDPAARELAGADGAMISSADDLRDSLHGVHLGMISVALEAGSAFIPAAAQLSAVWEFANIEPSKCRGAFNADPLGVLAREGHLPWPIAEGLARAADLAAWTSARFSNVTAIRVGTAPYHHAGATATQDLAFSMATALEYLRAMTRAGIGVDQAAAQLLFSYAVGTHQFLAIAKLRAARRLWGRVAQACGVGLDGQRMKMHVRPSKRVLTARDPWVNILRNCVCVFAAGLGGADAIGSEPFDAAMVAGKPGWRSGTLARRIARNTHLILLEECHLHRVVDAPGGSWYLERLTDEICERAWVILQAIESRGGMARCLEEGWVAQQIDTAAQPRWRDIATRKEALLGVSEFPSVGEHRPEPCTVNLEEIRREARERAARQRARPLQTSNASRVSPAISGAMSQQAFNLASQGATIGAITAILGNGGPPASIHAVALHPFSEAFEHLRDAADEYTASCGRRPRVTLVSIGTPADHLARTNYAKGFFEAGGFEVRVASGKADLVQSASEFARCDANIAVICSSDAIYATSVATLAPLLHAAGAGAVILAGNPGASEAAYREAGVDRFIYMRCDVVKTLSELLVQEGVSL